MIKNKDPIKKIDIDGLDFKIFKSGIKKNNTDLLLVTFPKFLYLTLEIAYLGKVSVVIIDFAASLIEFTKTGFLFLMQDVIFDGFNSSPITPVEDEKTSFSLQL